MCVGIGVSGDWRCCERGDRCLADSCQCAIKPIPFFPSLSSSLQVDYNSKIKNRMAAAGPTPSAAMAHSYDDQQVTFGAAQ